ncbi:hypothetical protein ACFLR1_03830 [Bacteroidota bacterium]
MRTTVFYLTLLCVTFGSCKPELDVELPVCKLELPEINDTVYTEDNLRLVASFSDNSGLLQYKLVLEGIDELNGIAADSVLSLIVVGDIPKDLKAFYLDEWVALSNSTFNGNMRAILSCLDTEGNESEKDTVDFSIRNSIDAIPPVINVSGPVNGSTIAFGQGFSTYGTVTDDQNLRYSDFYIGRTDYSDTILFKAFSSNTNNIVDYTTLGWWSQVDSSWSQGDYMMYLTAWDNYSGVSQTIPFHVSY